MKSKDNVLKEKKPRRFLKEENVKSFFKSINLFEIIWLSATIVILLLAVVFFPDLMLEDKNNTFLVVCSCITIVASPLVEILISKQSRYWAVFSLFFVEVTEVVILLNLGLYSSILINLCFWIPVDIVSFFSWGGKNKDEERGDLTKIKKLNWWQDILLFTIITSVGLAFGYVLTQIPNSRVTYVLALSNAFELANGVLLLLRYNEQWIAQLGYLICQGLVWIMLGHYIMLVTIVAMLINTIYGFIKWLLYAKKSKNKKLKLKKAVN